MEFALIYPALEPDKVLDYKITSQHMLNLDQCYCYVIFYWVIIRNKRVKFEQLLHFRRL